MQFMQLEMLVAVVQQGSISKAATAVYRTQPAVSGALKKLSEEVGEPLFVNSSRAGVTLTPVGRVLYESAEKILAMRDEALRAAEDVSAKQRGRLRVGADEATTLYFLPGIAERFHRLYPRSKLDVVVDSSANLARALAAREIDIAVVPEEVRSEEFLTVFLLEEDMVLITSPRTAFPSDRLVSVEDLQHVSLILEKSATAARTALFQAIEKHGGKPHLSFETASIEMIKRLVTRSLGIGFVPRMCVEEECAAGTLAMSRVQEIPFVRKLWAVRRSAEGECQLCLNFIHLLMSRTGMSDANSCRSAKVRMRRAVPATPLPHVPNSTRFQAGGGAD